VLREREDFCKVVGWSARDLDILELAVIQHRINASVAAATGMTDESGRQGLPIQFAPDVEAILLALDGDEYGVAKRRIAELGRLGPPVDEE
jgi:hypothetical protein